MRARSIKPSICDNELLGTADPLLTLLFERLWMMADREGRLEDRPLKIRAQAFPYRDLDCNASLAWLAQNEFIVRYEIDGKKYLQVANFEKHQRPHHMEEPSKIPAPTGTDNHWNHEPITKIQRERILSRDKHQCVVCKAKKPLHIDHIVPITKGGDSSDENLRVLCGPCNTSKGDKTDSEWTSSRYRLDNGSTTTRQRPDKSDSRSTLTLTPSSLTPDSLNLDCLTTTACKATPAWFEDFRAAYPPRAGDQGWHKAQKAANARVAEGHTAQEFLQGARRYAAFIVATGKANTEFVQQAATFLGPGKPFLLPWTAPAEKESAMDEIRRLNGVSHERIFEAESNSAALVPFSRALRG